MAEVDREVGDGNPSTLAGRKGARDRRIAWNLMGLIVWL